MQDNINIPDSNITADLTFRNLVIMNMQALTNFPYIEKDFDALTDYQLLCLVVKYLNDVIENQNDQNDSITSMYNAFLSLQNYVNNTKDSLEDAFNELDTYVRTFFANLDVQEEIDNKLDEMVEDGTLADIITNYLNTKALFCYDNVAELKLATNLMDGSYVKTLGFYAINDGGGATYKVRTKTNADTPNEMDMIAIGDSLVAILNDNLNNCLCYGVKSNDSNNNNHTIIKYVVDNKKSAFIPIDITLNNSLVLDTADSNFTFEKITYTGNSHAIQLNNHDINITGQHIISSHDGLKIGGSNPTLFCYIKLNRIEAENIGVLLGDSAGVYYNNLDILRIDYKTNGIKVLLDNYYVGEISINNTSFTDLNDDTTERFAFHCNATNYRATGFTFNNISFEGSHGGFYFEGTGKLCEHLYVYGLRSSEASYKGYKILKVKCNQTTIPLYGDIFFDNANPSSFDFSEYTVTENSSLMLHGAFRTSFGSSNDLLGYEGHPNYTRLVITKLPRGYDTLRASNTPQLVQATNIVANPHQTDPTNNPSLKLKLGDSSYVYNGDLHIAVYSTDVTSIDFYSSDGTTLVRSIPTNGTLYINASFAQFLNTNQTSMMYTTSTNGGASNLD